jgi:SpoVK/Ycf46/Vps4 family AAA+-type ATPase
MLAPEVIYEVENGVEENAGILPEVDMAAASNPAITVATKGIASHSPTRAQWVHARAELAAQVVSANAAYQSHPGSKEWESYVASDACKAMMMRFRTVAYDGINWALAHHWKHLWPGKEAKALVRDFKAKARVEVLIPSLINPSANTQLRATVISWNLNSVSDRVQTFQDFKAVDPRFQRSRPVIFLSWDTISPWSIIVPGQGFWQIGTFWYKDEQGKVWDSGQVISQVYYGNLQKPEVQDDFRVLDSSFARLKEHGALYNELSGVQRQLATLDKKIEAWSKVSLPEPQFVELTRRAEMFAKGDPAAPRGLLLTGPSGTGKTLIASSVAASLKANFQKLSLPDVKQSNLGASGQRVREIWNHARQNQPAVIFVDECEGVFGQRGAATTDVVSNEIVQAFLAEWDGLRDWRIWVIGATNRRDLIDDAIISRFGWEMVIGLPGPDERRQILDREMQAVAPGCVVPEEMGSLTQGMSGRDLQNLASQIRTIAYPAMPAPEHFLEAVKATRKSHNTKVDQQASWDTLVLDSRVLQQLQLTCTLLRDAETWRAQGVDVPRSLLLTGPPGTGKTQIGRTLANEGGLAFAAATTADVKANFLGQSGNQVKLLFQRARTQAPVILFFDELDIIAPARVGSNDPLTDEIVGQLLQEMDGIQAQDSQVFLLAATNHPENVDRAILSRFRKTLVIPLPDEEARRRLLTIMLGKKRLGFNLEQKVAALAARTEAMSGRDLQNYVGRAEQNALIRAMANGGPQHFSLQLEDFG